MSRRFTLEEYLESFVDEKTQPGDEIMLHISDAEARSVGLFFIECMGGILQYLRRERATTLSRGTRCEQSDDITDEVTTDENELIN